MSSRGTTVAGGATVWLLLGILLAAALPARGTDPPRLESLFPQRMPLESEGGRLARTFLPAEVVTACRGGLRDLRLLDSRGVEVPYAIDSGRRLEMAIEKRLSFEPEIGSVERSRQQPENAPAYWRESYTLDLTVAVDRLLPPSAAGWELVLEIGNREFVRTLRVDDGSGELLASGSLFRLTDPLRERLRFPLVPFASETVRVTIEGEDGSYLEPVFRLESSTEIAGAERNELELELVSARTAEGVTTVELDRPPGLVPDRLRVATSTAAFNRVFEIWDEGPASDDRPLAVATLFRLRATAEIEETELALRRARGDRLRVVIDNGDSPPLSGLTFTAVLRRPAILFTLPEGETGGMLYFGGGRAHRPRYDVTSLLPALPASGSRATLAGETYDPSKLAPVRLGAVEPNPQFDPSPALGFALRAGRELDSGSYTHSRRLTAPESADGLIRHQLALDTIAEARSDLGDLRILDAARLQRPYLLERRGRFQTVPLEVELREVEGGASRYTLALPVSPMVVDEIVIDPPISFFERSFELDGGDPNDSGSWRRLARGVLSRREGDRRKVHLLTSGELVSALRLTVEDHDDAPLDLGSVELRYQATELFFAARAGEYSLLVGNPDAAPPRYELAAVRDVVLAVDAATATSGPLGENPDYSATARFKSDSGFQQLVLWLVLGLAVVVLGWFSFRLTRRER